MLTSRAGRLRDWALFSAAALMPAVAVGALGLRALATAEAGARREVALGLAAAARDLARDVEVGTARASADLEGVSLDPDATRTLESIARLTPGFASHVVLGADRALVVPEPPADSAAAPATASRALSLAKCRELAQVLATPKGRDAVAARRELLDRCPDVTSPSGRLLWPVVALDAASRGLVADDAVTAWMEARGRRLSEAEREATRRDVAASLTGAARARAERALSSSWSRRDALVAEIQGPTPSAALREAPHARGLVTWRADTSIGALRRLDDGRLAGFVVDAASLEDALAGGALPVPAHVRAFVTRAIGSTEAAPLRADHLLADALVAPDLVVRVVPSDPAAVARQASRSRAILLGLGGFAIVAAFALAAALFARMRAARTSSALRTDFVAAVSHELRTPIASMRMLAELLEEGRVEAEEQPEIFEALAREARRLGETVERLLGFSRMAAGRYVIERREANVAAVVAAAIDAFEDRNPEMPRVTRVVDEEATASIDAGQVRLVLDNLLANARKYAPEGTPYRVTLRRDGEGVAVTVADSGPGIARRDRARIFEPFERADDRLSRATEGTGIGLSLARHVATAHGGRIGVESEPGRGAAFTLWLPSGNKPRRTT